MCMDSQRPQRVSSFVEERDEIEKRAALRVRSSPQRELKRERARELCSVMYYYSSVE